MLPEWTLLRFIEVFLCVLVIKEICLWFYQRQKTVKTRKVVYQLGKVKPQLNKNFE